MPLTRRETILKAAAITAAAMFTPAMVPLPANLEGAVVGGTLIRAGCQGWNNRRTGEWFEIVELDDALGVARVTKGSR